MPQISHAFSKCIIIPIKIYCVSSNFFYPLTSLIVLPPKKKKKITNCSSKQKVMELV